MSDLNEQLLEQLLQLSAQLHRFQILRYRDRGPLGNPHRGQGRVLSILKLQPKISQKELSYLLDMRNQSLGELLGKLEQKGYLTRKPSETDRRTAMIELTPEGEAAANSVGDNQGDTDKLFASLSDEEKAELEEYLARLIASLEETLAQAGADDRRPGFDGPPHRGPHHGGPDPRLAFGGLHEPHGPRGPLDRRGGWGAPHERPPFPRGWADASDEEQPLEDDGREQP